MQDLSFYNKKRVFITGHTGFKGTWLCKILSGLGAQITGYALEPPTDPNLFAVSGISTEIDSIIGDIRDYEKLKKAFDNFQPEIVFHLAAQPIVREGYREPRSTYEINVMGTVNILECIRNSTCVRSFLNVTTDKVYKNKEWVWGYRETEPLDGFDPYSNSKSCSELVTHSYQSSYFTERSTAISTARAGNVIGGGDFAKDRIIPDCVKAAANQKAIIVRNPYSARPYQHVLEPLFAYLLIAQCQYSDKKCENYFNVGPNESDYVATGKLADLFCRSWGNGLTWVDKSDGGPHEASMLKLDCSLIKSVLNWEPCWSIEKAIQKTVEWTKSYLNGEDISECMAKQISEYYGSFKS
jgi:CDP-glucose 4,6-dehydratase